MDNQEKKPIKKTLKNKVIWVLKTYPQLRDDKLGVCRCIWSNELMKLGITTTSPVEILDLIMDGRLSSPESICRWFRMIQENKDNIPEWVYLRGPKWHERQQQQDSAKKHFGVR